MHCDIHLPNIVFIQDHKDFPYVLIDFEHTRRADEPFEELLTVWDSKTLVNGQYTVLSELYQVGKMMDKFDAILSEQGKQFVAMLKGKQTAANEALLHAWINVTD